MSQLFRESGIWLGLGVAGLIVFLTLYDHVSPRASIDFRYSRDEIMLRADDYARDLGHNVAGLQQDCWFYFGGSTHLYLQIRGGMKYANETVRADSLPVHSWLVQWYDKRLPPSQFKDHYRMWISPGGTILGFDHVVSDTLLSPSVAPAQAESLARTFLREQDIDLSRFTLKSSSQTKLMNRTDHRFVWSDMDTTLDASLWIRVQGDEIGGFRRELTGGGSFKRAFSNTGTQATFYVMLSFAGCFLLFFFIVILFLKKYHEGEVGIKTALLVLLVFFVVRLIAMINEYPVVGADSSMGDFNRYNVRIVMFVISTFILHLFLGVMVFAGWSVGESSSRGLWARKLVGVDSVLSGKLFTIDVAQSTMRGYGIGFLIMGVYSVLLYFGFQLFDIGLFVQSVHGVPEGYVPALQPVLQGVAVAAFNEVVFRLFFLSYLREKTKRKWVGVLVSSAIWTIIAFTCWDLPFGFLQFSQTFPVIFLFGVLFSILFIRYDLATCLSANFVIIALNAAVPILSSEGAYFQSMSVLFWVFMGMPIIIATIGWIRGARFEFGPAMMPTHIQRISERVRMAKELEIARNVQMSLLPKSNPDIEGYDIAGICLPAMEVGGDYYDYVFMGPGRLGIAIGDVSGKGVPAAIYMTLTKGILQSHAEEHISPKDVLKKVNSLMYKTIDRNTFVSMFYAVLEGERRVIRFARAGQCPAIVAQRIGESARLLTPRGIALGLETGKIFDSVLEEEEMEVCPGDVLVFYTDGFTEAMNAQHHEFSESRLVETIARNKALSSSDIIKAICTEVAQFTNGHPQHDDMTMVVVKVE